MFDFSNYLQALVSISGTHPRLFAVGLALIAAYVVPKVLAVATISRFPQFSAGCNAICLDVVKAMKIFASAVVSLRGAMKVLALATLCFATQACTPKYSFVSAKDSEGDSYEFCFKVVGKTLAFTGKAMGCADVESQVVQQEQAFLQANPGVKTVRVRQLKVARD
jgi:hypothetical protein